MKWIAAAAPAIRPASILIANNLMITPDFWGFDTEKDS